MFFGDESTFDPQSDLIDLKGKVAVVTGGNRGNGYATVKHLARAGAKVYLGCRNDKRAKEAMEYLRWEGLGPGFGEVVWLDLDMSSPKRAKAAAEEILRRERRLDILVNNAGVFSGQFRGGDGALSTMVTVNYLSPFVFTKALLPLLAATALNDYKSDVRVVNVVSASHKLIPFPSLKFKTIDDLNARSLPSEYLRFSHSKLLCLLWTEQLQRLIDTAHSHGPLPILAISVDPGVTECPNAQLKQQHNSMMTNLRATLSKHFTHWTGSASPVIAEHERGNSTAFAAAAEIIWAERGKYKGVYLEPCPNGHFPRILSAGMFARDGEKDKERERELAEELWGLTESVLVGCGVA